MANRNWLSNKLYQMEAYPVHLTCKFTVTPSNGAGITALTGAGIRNVFMHTSTTPSAGNPNPANGIIMVQLQDNYSKLLQASGMTQAPLTGSDLTSTTANTLYQITALGTATTAQWVAKGLPVGVTPAVGAAFIATASGSIGGSATVKAVTTSGISAIELVGVSNAQNAVNPAAPSTQGMYLYFQCLAPSGTVSAPTFTGTPATLTGSVAAPVFTGDALATHDHSIPPGTDGSGGTSGATSAGTPTGTNSAPALTMDEYTPAGTISAPTLTGAQSLAAPATGTIITLDMFLSNSSVTVQGQ